MTDHILLYDPDLEARATSRLYRQWRDKVRISAFTKALAAGAQALEDQTFALLTGSSLSTAFGATLDRWGALVDEPRGGLDDDEYRLFIGVRIYANRCIGNVDDLIWIAQQTTAPSVVRHTTLYPGGGKIIIYRQEWMSDARKARVGRLIRDVKPAGHACPVVECIVGHAGWETGWTEHGPTLAGPLARLL